MKSQIPIKLIYLFFLLSIINPIHSQIIKVPDYFVETGVTLSAGRQTPFWLVSNQYGLITPDKLNGWIRLRFKTTLSPEKKIDYDYGLDVINRLSNNKNKLYLHQAYFRLKFHFLSFQAGSIEEKFGDQDSSLSSGGLIWSGNARTIPNVSLMVPEYTPLPFTKGFIEFKGGISHGWMGDNQFVKNTWLHHKYLYLQLGGKLPVHMNFGIHHFALWGGESTDPAFGKLPQSWNDFIDIFFAKAGDETAPGVDQAYVLGDHLGSKDVGFDMDFKRAKISICWQSIFEDRNGLYWSNIKDGLWGIYLHLKEKDHLINAFGYEFINTTNQSGPVWGYWLLNGVKYYAPVNGGVLHWLSGNDNYFNHYYYKTGWTLDDMTIGTPMITSPAILQNFDIDNNTDYIRNNKITGHHFSLEGKYKYLLYKLFVTYSLNFGTNNYPMNPALSQYSFLLNMQLSEKLPWGLNAGLSIGYDYGDLLGNNAGLKISLAKEGCLGGK